VISGKTRLKQNVRVFTENGNTNDKTQITLKVAGRESRTGRMSRRDRRVVRGNFTAAGAVAKRLLCERSELF